MGTIFLYLAIILISCNGCGSNSKIGNQNNIKKIEQSTIQTGNKSGSKNENPLSTEIDLGILKDVPMLPLEEADITEVYDHYILQDTANNQKYHFYDGSKQQTVDFSGPDVHIQVSRNGKYLSKMKLVQNKMSNQYFLDVELRDASNKIIAKQPIPSAYQDYYDEIRDDIVPLEDGSGFLQIGRRLGITYWVTGYKMEESKFVKKFQINQPKSFLHDLKVNDDGSKVVIKYNTQTENYESDTLALYSMEKGLLWKKKLSHLNLTLKHQWDDSKTFLNMQDIYLFSCYNEKDRIIRYNFHGQIVDSFEVEQIQHWGFMESKEGEVLLIYSNKFLYIYNTKSKEVNKIDLYGILQLKGNATIWIRNAIFSKSIDNETENLIFTLVIDAYPKDKTFFNGVLCYSIKGKTIKAFQSTPFYGKLTRRGNGIFLQKNVSSYFDEKIPKIDLNKIK